MSEGWVVALAAAVWLGASLGLVLGPDVAVILAALGLLASGLRTRQPFVLVVAGFVASTSMAHHADASYVLVESQAFSGELQLIGLPRQLSFGEQAEAKLPDGRRVLLTVSDPAPSLSQIELGSRIAITGRLKPIEPNGWFRSRHLVGTVTTSAVDSVSGPSLQWHAPNAVRGIVQRSATSMPAAGAALYQGLVIGDDRDQTVAQRAQFRASGLAHLLAVSGQNVAFVLALMHPVLARLGTHARIVCALAVLGLFALVTQTEPSVLRATVTGGLGYWAFQTGRQATGLRLLGIAVSLLILVDPFIVSSIGFQLSVGASAGILLLSPAIRAMVAMPDWLATPLAVTVSAQLAVAPVLIATFGPIGLVSLPANLAAGWAAGLVMAWGMSAGLIAGMSPSAVATVIQLPARALVWWIGMVAVTAARLPIPTVGASAALSAVALALLISLVRSAAVRRSVAIAAGLGLLVVSRPNPDSLPQRLEHAWFVPGTPSVLVLEARVRPDLIDTLISNHLINVDHVVMLSGGRSSSRSFAAFREVLDARSVLAPPNHQVRSARRLLRPITLPTRHGALQIAPSADGQTLLVDCVEPCSALRTVMSRPG